MEITINIKGLEGLTSAIEKIAMGQISMPEYLASQKQNNSTQTAQVSSTPAPTQQVQTTPAVQVPTGQNPTTPTGVPTTTTTYTLDQLAVAATPISDSGRVAELQQLLAGFGVQSLTQLPQEKYGEFATALRGMGAKI